MKYNIAKLILTFIKHIQTVGFNLYYCDILVYIIYLCDFM